MNNLEATDRIEELFSDTDSGPLGFIYFITRKSKVQYLKLSSKNKDISQW